MSYNPLFPPRMNLRSGIAVIAITGLTIVPLAAAKNPPKPNPPNGGYAVSLGAKPNPVVFSKTTTLSGSLAGPSRAGVSLRLEQDNTLPLGDSFQHTALTTVTASSGAYQFALRPSVNSQYRVVAMSSPAVTSPTRLVSVRPLTGLKLSDSTPRRGARVRFSGSVYPAHDGSSISVQRRSATGRWSTVARTPLTDAGTARSAYSRSLRIRSDGVYRVKLPSHNDHTNGISRSLSIKVH